MLTVILGKKSELCHTAYFVVSHTVKLCLVIDLALGSFWVSLIDKTTNGLL